MSQNISEIKGNQQGGGHMATTQIDRAQSIVRRTIDELEAGGFRPWYVADGESNTRAQTPALMMREAFAVEMCHLWFKGRGDKSYWLLIIPENGADVLSDWSVPNTPEGRVFDAILDRVIEEETQ